MVNDLYSLVKKNFLRLVGGAVLGVATVATAIPLFPLSALADEWDKRIEELQRIVVSFPDDTEMRYKLGELYWKKAESFDKKSQSGLYGFYKNKGDSAFLEGIEINMGRLTLHMTVEHILKPLYDHEFITKVKWDYDKGESNFRELIYQEHVPAQQRKPVLMLVCENKSGKDVFKREAIIFELLKNLYRNKFKFVVYDPTIDPAYTIVEKCKDSPDRAIYGNELISEGLVESPSLMMYSLFELVSGETPDKNNGKIKQVDILRGGPTENSLVPALIYDLTRQWIAYNLEYNYPREKVTYKYLNKQGANLTTIELQ